MSQKQEEENPAEETGEEKQDTQEKEGILPERAEEAKLKAKYPSLGQKPGGSDFLMKRLQKGVRGIVSYPLSLEPKEVLRMKSVEVLLDPFLEVLLLNRSRGEFEI
ncbi:ENSA isoform 15 [Pan troglodytes]|uniref:ENSA isoform 12 n=1 Tax=Pan troglodytes TaxID=9598 RepID=A0A2J8JJ67_PANTR|nr:ENSA isoform 5 [Pan troglodytes]PNI22806.1 ENSA isoform 12 [Pan troglodytes]PNI22808.1 ENSA isoform 15 [Pan troglodytes]